MMGGKFRHAAPGINLRRTGPERITRHGARAVAVAAALGACGFLQKTPQDTPAQIAVPTPEVQSMAESQNQDTIKPYVGDMYSMESHIEEALDSQVKKNADHPKPGAGRVRGR